MNEVENWVQHMRPDERSDMSPSILVRDHGGPGKDTTGGLFVPVRSKTHGPTRSASGAQLVASRSALLGVVSTYTISGVCILVPQPCSNRMRRTSSRRYHKTRSASLVGANFHITNVGTLARRSKSSSCDSSSGSISTISPGAVIRVTASSKGRFWCSRASFSVTVRINWPPRLYRKKGPIRNTRQARSSHIRRRIKAPAIAVTSKSHSSKISDEGRNR
jgi:hypothetical protein